MVLPRSRAAFRVALDGDASPAAASSRLLVFLLAGAARSRRAGHRGVLPARGMAISTGAGFVPFCSRVDQLLDSSCHVGELIGSQPIELFCGRLSGSQILERGGVDGAIHAQHAGNGCAALLDETGSARAARRRRPEGGAVNFALVGLGEASHRGYLLALRDEGKAVCLQGLGVGVGRDGDGEVVHRRLLSVTGVLA